MLRHLVCVLEVILDADHALKGVRDLLGWQVALHLHLLVVAGAVVKLPGRDRVDTAAGRHAAVQWLGSPASSKSSRARSVC